MFWKLSVMHKSLAQHITQLYEQGVVYLRIEEYVKHWLRWVRAGVALQIRPFKVWGTGGVFFLYPTYCCCLTNSFSKTKPHVDSGYSIFPICVNDVLCLVMCLLFLFQFFNRWGLLLPPSSSQLQCIINYRPRIPEPLRSFGP